MYLSLQQALGNCDIDVGDRWNVFQEKLAHAGASTESLRAADRRLRIDSPPNAKAIAILAADDGTTMVDYDLETPVRETATFSSLPSAGLLIEWQHRKIPSLLIHVDEHQAEVETYAIEGLSRRYRFSYAPPEMIKVVGKLATAVGAQLVILAGNVPHLPELADGIVHRLPLTCRLVTEPEASTKEELTAAMIRQLGVGSAGVTLRYLREQRFLATHGAAVEGIGATIAALQAGDAELLLIHDSAQDRRTVWIGDLPRQISRQKSSTCPTEVPLVDGLIRCAILCGVEVRMIPAVGPSGPVDDVAALTLRGDLSVGL